MRSIDSLIAVSATAIRDETHYIQSQPYLFTVHTMSEIVQKAAVILGSDDECMIPGKLMDCLDNLIGNMCMWTDDIEGQYLPTIPRLILGVLARHDAERFDHDAPDWQLFRYVFEGTDADFYALAVCFPKYWKCDRIPQSVKLALARLVMMYQKVLAQKL